MKMNTKLLTLICAGVVLAGCAHSQPATQTHTDNFGTAVAANIAAQSVDPTPEQKANTYIPANAARRALAKRRYEKDEVETPVPISTTN